MSECSREQQDWVLDELLHSEGFLKKIRKDSFVNLMSDLDQGLPEVGFEGPFGVLPSLQHLVVEYQEPIGPVLLKDIELPKPTTRRTRSSKKARKPVPALQQEQPKQIGTITLEQRRVKILRYLEKRKRRRWGRKISYDCRKRVADSRLRCKGRFIKKDQGDVNFSERLEDAI